jgi:hypothetical protein
VVSVDFFNHIWAFPCQRELVLPHLGDRPKDVVTFIEVWLHEVSVGVAGLHLLPSLAGDLRGDLFV